MMRYRMHTTYGWIIMAVILAFILLVMAATLFSQPAIATVDRIEESPGQVLYRSQDRLQDQSGVPRSLVQEWQTVATRS